MKYAKAFGRRLKSIREAAGLTQEQVAERTRGDAKYLSALENGRSSPTLDTIMGLAKALNVPDSHCSIFYCCPQSELFGHERGAFTGALMQKKGRFEIADGGSLFLDEIGDIPLELQPKLLRAVQEQEFERLGSTHMIHVNVRMIAATQRNLPGMIREGKFREDLFYRLNVFPVAIPPLRERREDIPLLVNYFVSKLSRQMGRQIKTIPLRTIEVLTSHPWKGNVRELANFLDAVVLSQGEELEVPTGELTASYSPETTTLPKFEQAAREVIMDALRAASGRIAGKGGAAERLGLKRTTLQNKMRKLGINRANGFAGLESGGAHA